MVQAAAVDSGGTVTSVTTTETAPVNGQGVFSEIHNRKLLSYQGMDCLAFSAAPFSSFSWLPLEFSKVCFLAAKRSYLKPFEMEPTGTRRHFSGRLGCHFNSDGLKQKENPHFILLIKCSLYLQVKACFVRRWKWALISDWTVDEGLPKSTQNLSAQMKPSLTQKLAVFRYHILYSLLYNTQNSWLNVILMWAALSAKRRLYDVWSHANKVSMLNIYWVWSEGRYGALWGGAVSCTVKCRHVQYLAAVRTLSKNNAEALPAGGERSQPLEEERSRVSVKWLMLVSVQHLLLHTLKVHS